MRCGFEAAIAGRAEPVVRIVYYDFKGNATGFDGRRGFTKSDLGEPVAASIRARVIHDQDFNNCSLGLRVALRRSDYGWKKLFQQFETVPGGNHYADARAHHRISRESVMLSAPDAWWGRRVRQSFQPPSRFVTPDSNQRVAFLDHHICGGIEDHIALTAPDRDDYHAVFRADSGVFKSTRNKRRTRADLDLFHLELEPLGHRRQFDEIGDCRSKQ